MSTRLGRLLDIDDINQQIANGSPLMTVFKEAAQQGQAQLNARFEANDNIFDLIYSRALMIDKLIDIAWQQFDWADANVALLAVGGYGRAELHPHSDIDLLIVLADEPSAELEQTLSQFITFLWDTSLQIGHSVRTLQACAEEAEKDITIVTNMIESRTLAGNPALLEQLRDITSTDKMWPSSEFFQAKYDEQIKRHRKFGNTEYNLEPNIKSCPGGLRDLQNIAWVAKRHYGVKHLSDLVEQDFITDDELNTITDGLEFMWRVRYALHMITDREEDRLLFDHQKQIALMFGYESDDKHMAVEYFMKQYFRWAMALAEVNEMLLQLYDEAILRACDVENIMEVNPRFRIVNDYLDTTSDRVMSQTPSAMIEMFIIMAQNKHIKGVRASTLRQIRQNRHLINEEFRADPKNKTLFLEVLRGQTRVASGLKRMKRWGILGNYIPAFGQIVGQTQHDLFHIYSVDAHTMLVLINMRSFNYEETKEKWPIAYHVMGRLPKVELLYLAGLFHDIGKGRGGDHSKLGAVDAYDFCRDHGYSRRDANLVSWLVKNHLRMSTIAQKKDVSDPDVIRDFAEMVGDQVHLDYLFTLTVADINATNPTLWNSWRASLMRQLYLETKRALRRGLENHIDKQDWIDDTQQAAVEKLLDHGFSEKQIKAIWDNPGDDYFLRESVADIVWHTEEMSAHDRNTALVAIKPSTDRQFDGATQIFVHTRNKENLFIFIVNALEQLNLSIVDARIISSESGFSLDTFFVLGSNGEAIDNEDRLAHIQTGLTELLNSDIDYLDIVKRRTPRALKHFSIPTQTSISTDLIKSQTVLEVISPDRPGLLATIGEIFIEFNIEIQNAKITTLGERVEDIFFITDQNNGPITDPEKCEAIQSAIKKVLDRQAAE